MRKQHLVIYTALLAGSLWPLRSNGQQSTIPFQARGIITLSDADMAASTVADGYLHKGKGTRDALTVISFPLDRSGQNIGQASVSNSSALYDKTLAITPNGRVAFVLEGHGPLNDSLTTLKNGLGDLPLSSKMFTVDLSIPGKPVVRYGFNVGNQPTAVVINPQGNLLAVASGEAGKEIRLVEVDNTGKPTRIVTAASPVDSARITNLIWHPGGRFIAYIIGETQEIGLLKLSTDNARKPTLIPHGKPIKVGSLPATGRFTPDGNFLIVSDIKKNANAQGAGKGELFVVQLSTDDAPGESKIISQVASGESAEALAISPDGSTVVIANSNQSYQPYSHSAAGKSSLSIYTLSKAGQLQLGNDYPFEGVMPQSVEFDKSGNTLAVAVYEYLDYGDRKGAVEFWKVNKSDKPSLERLPAKITVNRGCHTIKVY
ncbi:beta-propeller fold lactonase family protein [Tellurirhabdus bombi]|uniref:beta-propeller fold lactonase family protein n=1 Tax=Tellurirhabdus bombi TaxID=2907205 RepID=UPI001F2A3542|nr:beta-propeller fold lactonase family protein [Tellurirhabdus bombi]